MLNKRQRRKYEEWWDEWMPITKHSNVGHQHLWRKHKMKKSDRFRSNMEKKRFLHLWNTSPNVYPTRGVWGYNKRGYKH